MTQLELFLSLRDFDDYMAHFEALCGLPMDGRTFRKELDLMDGDANHTHWEKEKIRDKRRREHLKSLHSSIEQLKAEITEAGAWITPIEEETIDLLYRYPNDKRGDVDNYLAELYYEPQQVDVDLYAVTIPTEDLDIIELLAFPSRLLFLSCDETDPAVAFLLRNNRVARIERLMFEVNYYKQEYRNLRTIPDIELRRLLTDYHNGISSTRDKIYESLISEGATHPRWISEQETFRIVKAYYPDAKFQYQAPFLRGQRLDIFIPSKSVAIEYQGKQHYEAVGFFGGREGYRSNRERDDRKRRLCKANGMKVVYWDYDKPLTEEYFVEAIKGQVEGQNMCTAATRPL